MPARWKMGLALLALATAGRLGAEPLTPRAVMTRCASQVDAKLTGISALSRSCPDVRDALDQLHVTGFLPSGWQKTLTASGLADVGELVRRYAGPPASEAPKTTGLRSIAAGLLPQPPPATWLQRITAWIRHSLQPLGQWLRSLGAEFQHPRHPQAVFYGVAALLLLAVAALLAVELRGTGLIRPLRRAGLPPRRRPIAASSTESLDALSPEPDWARLREHPARLLRLLVATLTRAHRLERDRHLTCRELETEARFETELERAGFARVARLAERELYGPAGVIVLSEDVLRDARTLHDRLLAAAAEGRGGPP